MALAFLLTVGCARDARVYGGMIDTDGDGVPDSYTPGDDDGFGDDGTGYDDGSGNGNGNGSGNGSGAGSGSIGFNGPLGDVTAYFLNLLGNVPSYWRSNWPHHFKITGPTKIQVFSCYAYQIELRTLGDGVAYLSGNETLQAQLTDSAFGTTNGGAFFSDARCQQGIATLTFTAAASRKTVYYSRAMIVPSLLLKADARYQAWNVIGRFHIAAEANPKYQLPICFNFEDMKGRPGSDDDHNDAVLQTPAGSLFTTNDKRVEAYNNERVTLRGTGTSACDSTIEVEHRRKNGTLVATKTIASARAGGTVTFDMLYQDRLSVAFTARGTCASGKKPATDPAVRVSNTCRKASDEGNRWN